MLNQTVQTVVPFNGTKQKFIGQGQRVYVIAEIGINHNGSLDIAKQIIDGAVFAGADAVKFQKRTAELCTPKDQWNIERDTPWGRMTYIEYRRRIEFSVEDYKVLADHCKQKNIDWFVSCWDESSVDDIEQLNPPLYKAASASLTDLPLLKKMKSTGKPLIISTGMSNLKEIETAVQAVGQDNLVIAHSTSAYPCKAEELNLNMIHTLKKMYPSIPIGYSGHEVGLATTLAAVAMGSCLVERHVTIDRSMWGSDQSASVEIMGLHHLIRDIRDVEKALGDGVKKVYDSEMVARKRLRRVESSTSV